MGNLSSRALLYFEQLILTILIITVAFSVFLATYLSIYFIYLKVFVTGLHISPDESQQAIQHALYNIYGSFLTILLGLELINTVKLYFRENHIKVESILVISILAIARHLIQLHLESTDPMLLIGLASVLGVVIAGYFVLRRNIRIQKMPETNPHPANKEATS